ncbi:MAG TPA: ribonuclease activity regulator RraA [Chloroflexota bacterium]|nr:ribonuclease activity regulator RraA [Chloroflexota bacterium]
MTSQPPFDPSPSPALPQEIAERLSRVSTATLTSVLLKLGLRGPFMTEVRPLVPGTRLVGQAYTLRYIPMREDLDHEALEGRFDNLTNPQRIAIEHVGPGDVLVIDARGELRAGTIGNILVTRMKARGAAGLVTDGAFRDAAGIAAVGLPAYCRGTHAATNVTLHHPVDVQLPIACGGVAVYPGDALVGDGDGVIVIPRHLAEEAAARALEQERRERFILGKVRAGASIIGVYPPNAETLAEFERSEGMTGGTQRLP